MTSAKLPERCETMTEVRAGVDQVDRELVALLVRRFGYMDAALRASSRTALRSALMRAVWNELVEQSIAYEATEWDRLRAGR